MLQHFSHNNYDVCIRVWINKRAIQIVEFGKFIYANSLRYISPFSSYSVGKGSREIRNRAEESSKYLALIHTSHAWRAWFISRIVVEFKHVMKLVFQPLLPLHSANIKPLSARVLRNNVQCVLTIARFTIQSISMLNFHETDCTLRREKLKSSLSCIYICRRRISFVIVYEIYTYHSRHACLIENIYFVSNCEFYWKLSLISRIFFRSRQFKSSHV